VIARSWRFKSSPAHNKKSLYGFFCCLVHDVSRILFSNYVGMMIISLASMLPLGSNELTFHQREALALLFLQAGFTAPSCHQEARTVAFDYRPKTSVHFSPFSRLNRDSIVSAALSRTYCCQYTGGCYPLPRSHKM
jgi:hypothetical protein